MFLSDKVPLVGVDVGSHSLKVAQFNETRNGHELTHFAMMPLPYQAIVDGLVKNPEYVVDGLTQLLKAEKIKSRYAAASVSGEAVIIKKIKCEPMTQKELSVNIQKTAEQYIPFDIKDVSLDFQILKKPDTMTQVRQGDSEDYDANKMEVLLVAVQREIIDSRMELLQQAGLKPVIIDLDVFAMMNTVNFSENLERLGSVLLVDLGSTFTHINLVNYGFTYFTKELKTGGFKCTEKLQSVLEISHEEAEAIKQGKIPESKDQDKVAEIITDSFNPILNEIESIMEWFTEQTQEKVSRVFICGGGATINGVNELFEESLKVPVETINPLKGIAVDKKKFDHQCIADLSPIATVATGLGIRRFNYS